MNEDIELTCVDCGKDFTFTAGEQAFYNDRGYSQPRRCKADRLKKKQSRMQEQKQNNQY